LEPAKKTRSNQCKSRSHRRAIRDSEANARAQLHNYDLRSLPSAELTATSHEGIEVDPWTMEYMLETSTESGRRLRKELRTLDRTEGRDNITFSAFRDENTNDLSDEETENMVYYDNMDHGHF